MNSVVIGSGFGGIAAALRLKAKGHDVTLIEKHPDLGGRARVFKKNGFIYDGGPTVITAPYLINELFELFEKDPKNYIKLSPLKVWCCNNCWATIIGKSIFFKYPCSSSKVRMFFN